VGSHKHCVCFFAGSEPKEQKQEFKSKVDELKGELKEWKEKFRKFRHNKPHDPLCVEHAKMSKLGKLDSNRLDDMVLQFKERQMKKSSENIARGHTQFAEEKSKEGTNTVDYLTLCRANHLNPWGGEEVPM
jgi:hypothetical protein